MGGAAASTDTDTRPAVHVVAPGTSPSLDPVRQTAKIEAENLGATEHQGFTHCWAKQGVRNKGGALVHLVHLVPLVSYFWLLLTKGIRGTRGNWVKLKELG